MSELCEVFKLKDNRQILVNLRNKITMVDSNNAEVNDEELIKIIEKFRKEGCLTIPQACKKYGISAKVMNSAIRNKTISTYKLCDKKGSQYLIFEEQFKKENKILLLHEKQINQNRLNKFLILLVEIFYKENKLKDTTKNIVIDYYFNGIAQAAMEKKYDLTWARILMIVADFNKEIPKLIRFLLNSYNRNIELEQENQKLMTANKILIKKLDDKNIGDNYTSNMSFIKIEDVPEFSNRTKNCLISYEIQTLAELSEYTEEELLKIRDFGTKCLLEVKETLNKIGINLKK